LRVSGLPICALGILAGHLGVQLVAFLKFPLDAGDGCFEARENSA